MWDFFKNDIILNLNKFFNLGINSAIKISIYQPLTKWPAASLSLLVVKMAKFSLDGRFIF